MGQTAYLADTTRHLRPAGLGSSYHDTAHKCMTWAADRPTTPDTIKPYRQSTIHEPGVILRHYGSARDPVDDEATHGVVRNSCVKHVCLGRCSRCLQAITAQQAGDLPARMAT